MKIDENGQLHWKASVSHPRGWNLRRNPKISWGLRIDETGVTYVSISFSSTWMKFQRKSRNWQGKGKHQFFHPHGWNHRRNPKMQVLKNRWNWHDIATHGAVCHPHGWNPRKSGSETREIEERDDGRGRSEREEKCERSSAISCGDRWFFETVAVIRTGIEKLERNRA